LRNANGLTQQAKELKTFISIHNFDVMLISKRKQLGITLTKMQLLLRRKSKLSTSNKLFIYKTIFKPIWTYEMQLWGTASTSDIEILERFQSKALGMIVPDTVI
jgi:hypothetical protein